VAMATPRVRGRRTRGLLLVGVVACALALSSAPVVAQEPEVPPDEEQLEPDPELVARLEAARAAVTARVGSAAQAETERRQAEVDVVAAHAARRQTERIVATRVDAVAVARTGHRAAIAARDAAQEQFDRAILTAYKFGGTQQASLYITALQSAADAHEVARTLRQLDSVLGAQHEELLRLTEEAEHARIRVDRMVVLRDLAQAELVRREAAIVTAEEAATSARRRADAAEVAVLAAVQALLDAEEALTTAGFDPGPAPAVADSLVPAPTPDPAAMPEVGTRREWVANRQAVLATARRLAPADRMARTDLVCPVPGATFTNDYHYPRSHGRRHLGTDVFAPTGTPIVAMVDAVVTRIDPTDAYNGDGDLGGITVTYVAGRDEFYNAHLDTIDAALVEGELVTAGQVIGTVGDTGNARGGAPHLHLGWSVDGINVNPYPTLAIVCPGPA
jgi:peptidoglycan LD-endopeptidase LytH